MKLSKLKIENFRSVKYLCLDCNDKMNVFVGDNGAGKSTVLDAVTLLLSWYVARIKNVTGRGNAISKNDINNGASFSFLECTTFDNVSWSILKKSTKVRKIAADLKVQMKTDLAALTDFTNRIIEENDSYPVVAYYGVDRAVSEIPLRVRKKHRLEPENVYEKALDGKASFRFFFEWFREREDIENEVYRNANGGAEFKSDRQLTAVRMALNGFFQNYGSFRIRRHPLSFVMEKQINEDEKIELDFHQLSDGEKCYITLVCDIARKLAMANPNLQNPLEGEGIVLIDEIDFHLHPKWQGEVLGKLTDIFPNCQFFISTHSPFVVSSVLNGKGTIIGMKDGKSFSKTSDMYGREIDIVLADYFDVDPRGIYN